MQDRFQRGLITLLLGLGAFAATVLVLRREPVEPTPAPKEAEARPEALQGESSLTLTVVGDPAEACMGTLWEQVEGGRRMGVDSTKHCGVGGVLSWSGLSSGSYRVMVAAEGSERLDIAVDLEPGQTLDLGSRALGPGGGVRGTITNPDGEPSSVVTIRIGEREERSGAGGRFAVKGLSPGAQTLRFGSLDGMAELDVQVVAGEIQDLVVVLTPHLGVIGIRFDDLLTVVDVHPQGPAAGKIQMGERIESVNGVAFDDREELQVALEGVVGESVTLGLEGRQVTLVRIPLAEMMAP